MKPADGWPTRRVWISKFEDDHDRLRLHPLWQIATRLTPAFKAYALDAENRFVAWEMAHDREQPSFALFYQFRYGDRPDLVVAENPEVFINRFNHVVGMMGEHVFIAGREKQAFSWAIDILARRDPFDFVPLPVPQDVGEYHAGDLESLGDLAR
jgi:hypothetical protein